MIERNWPHNISEGEIRDMSLGEGTENNTLEPPYKYDRTENDKHGGQSIEKLHHQSFIDYIKSRLQESEFEQRKFKVLDMGGGAGVYADQIKKMCGDRVRVFTTGLRKKIARHYRQDRGLGKLPKESLKWRSILELNHEDKEGRPEEEFDLIINTWGEIPYLVEGGLGTVMEEDISRRLESFLGMTLAKLRPNGLASIYPILYYRIKVVEEILQKLMAVYNFQYEFIKNVIRGDDTFFCLKIKKTNLIEPVATGEKN